MWHLAAPGTPPVPPLRAPCRCRGVSSRFPRCGRCWLGAGLGIGSCPASPQLLSLPRQQHALWQPKAIEQAQLSRHPRVFSPGTWLLFRASRRGWQPFAVKGPGQPAAFPACRHAGFWDTLCFPWVTAKGGIGSKCPAWEGPRLPLLLPLLSCGKIMPALQGDPAGTQGPCWLCKGRKHQGTALGFVKTAPGKIGTGRSTGPAPSHCAKTAIAQRHRAAAARSGLFHLRAQSKTQTEFREREGGEVKPQPCAPSSSDICGISGYELGPRPGQDRPRHLSGYP